MEPADDSASPKPLSRDQGAVAVAATVAVSSELGFQNIGGAATTVRPAAGSSSCDHRGLRQESLAGDDGVAVRAANAAVSPVSGVTEVSSPELALTCANGEASEWHPGQRIRVQDDGGDAGTLESIESGLVQSALTRPGETAAHRSVQLPHSSVGALVVASTRSSPRSLRTSPTASG